MKNLSTLIIALFFIANIYGQGCWKKISVGGSHNIAIKNDGTLWAWGNNSSGQLGDSTNLNKNIPIQIGTSTEWKEISAGGNHSLAIKNDGTLWTWGNNSYGQLGNGTNGALAFKNYPVQIGMNTSWKTIFAGEDHSLAIKNDGTLWAWGDNYGGSLGDGTTTNSNTPIQIGTSTSWKEISAFSNNSLAIKTDGTLWAWGVNSHGQLGDGTNTNKNSPVQIGISSNWKYISAGANHTIAIKTDGTLWAWGYNVNGQLGDGTNINKNSPIQIGTSSNWNYISAGTNNTIAIKTDSSLWAWGYNNNGILGDGTTTIKNSPIQIGTGFYWIDISTKNNHYVVLKNDGNLFACGYNTYGQLGDGTNSNKNTPILIQCPTTLNPSGLIGYYPFNGNANDESGSNNNGTVYGANLTLDRFGNSAKAYSFNGTNSYINLGTNINPSIFTVSAWVQFNNITNLPAILSKIANVNGSFFKNFELGFSDNNGTPRCIVPNGSTWTQVNGNSSIGNNSWNQVLATYDGTTAKLYINGVLNQSVNVTYSSIPSSATYIGARPLNTLSGGSQAIDLFFNGNIDDVRIYNNALTSQEITDLYNMEKPPVTQTIPYITLSSSYLSVGQNLVITGKNFSPNYTDTLNIYSYQAQTNIKTPFTTNALGNFSQTISITATDKGRYLVSAKDTINNTPITPKMYEVSSSSSPIQNDRDIYIVSPTSEYRAFVMPYDNEITLNWGDKLKDLSNLIGTTSLIYKSYKIEYKKDGGNWQLITNQNFQKTGIYLETVFFNYKFKIPTVGNYQFRITDANNSNNWDTTRVFSVTSSAGSNMNLSLEWDWSGNRPERKPEIICADGTARVYLKVSRVQHNDMSIQSIKVSASDPHTPNQDPKIVGKLMKTEYKAGYDTLGNNAVNNFDEFSNLSDDKKSDYYFWYVAPDNFAYFHPFKMGSRVVNLKVEVKYTNGNVEEYYKQIQIVRPPLMLVHGWNSDESTWDDFKYTDGFQKINFKNNRTEFKAGVFANHMLPSNQFKDNAEILVSQADNGNSFASIIRGRRQEGIACNRVDYICHSMGGCMVRMAINVFPNEYNPPFNSSLSIKNYGKGFTNKIITINTPHNGSSGADLLARDILPFIPFTVKVKLYCNYYTSKFARNTFTFAPGFYDSEKLGFKIPKFFIPTKAVSNLQLHNPDTVFGGVRFSETKNIKAFMIASLDPNFSTNGISDAIYKDIQKVNGEEWSILNFMDLYSKTSVLGNALVLNQLGPGQLLNIINSRLKNAYDTDEYFPYSDGVVPLSSQLAQSSNIANPNYHFVVSAPILKSNHISAHNAIQSIGDKCYELLNTDIKSLNFASTFPANSRSGGIRARSGYIKPIDSTVEKFNDTTKYRLTNSIASLNYIDSTIAIQINVKDTIKLLANTIVFQGQMYFNKLEKGNLLYLLKVNPNYIDSQLLVTTLTYDSAGYNVHYNMTYPIKIVPQDTLRALTCEPKLKYLNAKEEYHPSIYANFGKYISNLALNNSDISISIADPNVMSFNGSQFVAKDTGTTYAIVSYRGLKDTMYFVISPPIEIVPEACVPPTVDFSVTTNGKVATCTNLSTNATTYKWSMGNGDILSTVNPVYTYSTIGDFLVCLTSYNNCDSTKICKTVRVNDSVSYSIGVATIPSLGGNVTGMGMYTMGQTCTLIAVANQGYQFLNWIENGTIVSTDLNYTFEVNRNRTLVANFKKIGTGILVNESKKWLIYPNPTSTSFFVELQDEKVQYAVLYNALGQKVIEKTLKLGKNEINVSHLAKGVYYIEIEDFEGSNIREKIIVE